MDTVIQLRVDKVPNLSRQGQDSLILFLKCVFDSAVPPPVFVVLDWESVTNLGLVSNTLRVLINYWNICDSHVGLSYLNTIGLITWAGGKYKL